MTATNSPSDSVPAFQFGHSTFSLRQGQVYDASKNLLPLRPKSAEVLAVLLRNRGVVVSKDQLAKEVWPGTIATDVTISRCISDIRKILNDPDHSVLETYPKRGYRLTTESPHVDATKKQMPQGHRNWWTFAVAGILILFAVLFFSEQYQVNRTESVRQSVAVLPFTYNGVSDLEYLASGLAEDLIISLTEIAALRVVPRSVSFDRSIPSLNAIEAGKALNSRYLIYGSVSRERGNLTISVKLVDTIDGATQWTQEYNGGDDVLLNYRSDIVTQLIKNISVPVSSDEEERLAMLQPRDRNTFDEILRARMKVSQFNYSDSLDAERIYRAVIERYPDYALPYAELAAAFAIRLENGWAVLTEADEQRALFYATEAIRLEPELWTGHYALGRLGVVAGSRDLDTAEQHLMEAIKLKPESDDARVYLAAVRIFAGKQDEAIPLMEAALASHPKPPFWYYLGYGHALFHSKRYNDAIEPLNTCLEQMPTAPYCLRYQIANYAQLNQPDDALWAADEYSVLGFDATISGILDVAQEQDPDNRNHLKRALQKAGLPD